MKHFYTSLLLVFLFSISVLQVPAQIGQDVIPIGQELYKFKVLQSSEPARGVRYKHINLLDFPLMVHILEADITKPYINMEVCSGMDGIVGREKVTSMASRKSYADHKIVSAVNGDFFAMAGETPGTPVGGEMVNGLMTKAPNTSEPILAFDRNGKPYMDFMTLSATITIANGRSQKITGLNSARYADDLILFNSLYAANTGTNPWGSEVLLSPVDGEWEKLGNYKNVKCKIEKKTASGAGGKMEIPQGKIVLSGHGVSSDFLINSVNVGDEVTVSVSAVLNSDKSLSPDFYNMIGAERIIMKKRIPSAVNPGDEIGDYRHPRTAAGFSKDSTKMYLMVIEGRIETSKGVTTRELADIMGFFGAYNAVNLDGGGSSCMVVNDQIKNVLSDGSERAVGNGLFVVLSSSKIDDVPVNDDISVFYSSNDRSLNLKVNALNEVDKLTVDIYNMHGKWAVSKELRNMEAGEIHHCSVDLAALPSGIYIYNIKQGGRKIKGKFLAN